MRIRVVFNYTQLRSFCRLFFDKLHLIKVSRSLFTGFLLVSQLDLLSFFDNEKQNTSVTVLFSLYLWLRQVNAMSVSLRNHCPAMGCVSHTLGVQC